MTDVVIRKTENLCGEVCAPSSKAYTQRMLIAGALSNGTSQIVSPLFSDDTEATLRAVKSLGIKVKAEQDRWIIEGAQSLKSGQKPIDCGESGATLRFMIPIAALASSSSIFVLGKSLKRRPIEPLLQSLRQLGVEAHSQSNVGQDAIYVQGGGISGGKTAIRGDISSQFISGLMFACPLAQADTQITLTTPLESESYVRMTEIVLAEHGIEVLMSEELDCFRIEANQTYKPYSHRVPGDFSSAAFLLAAAAITRSEVSVKNLDFGVLQGDKAILKILKQMGVRGQEKSGGVDIEGKGGFLEAVNLDSKDTPDLVPVCAVLACYAKGTTEIHGAHRLRYKESNRLLSLYLELKKMGAQIEMDESNLIVKGPCLLHGAKIDPHNDHRIAMACAIAGLGASGETRIQDAECVRKSYPKFFHDLIVLGGNVVGGEFDR